MSLGPPGAQLNPEQAENYEEIEKQFAVKVVQHMSTYWAILEKMRGSNLRLTKLDDEIYNHFKTDFPGFDPRGTIDEDDMKCKEGKEKWRQFISLYENKIDDYNFGTMLRLNPRFEYGEKETVFGREISQLSIAMGLIREPVVRMQFYAIEITRNKEGLNDWIYEKEHADAPKS